MTYFVSHPKSGRTWVRIMLNWYQQKTERPFHIYYTHTHLSDDLRDKNLTQKEIKQNRIIYMYRDAKDVVVSYYFHRKFREPKTSLYHYDGTISDFIRSPIFGVSYILRYQQKWNDWLKKTQPFIFTYEQLSSDTEEVIKKILRFLGEENIDRKVVEEIVEKSSFQKLKELESQGFVLTELAVGRRELENNPCYNQKNNNYFKIRRGEVGGYKKDLSVEDIKYLQEQTKDFESLPVCEVRPMEKQNG